MSKDLYFEVLDGRALEIVRDFIADYQRMRKQSVALAKEFGAEKFWQSHDGGHVIALNIRHPQFTKADRRRRSWPKKGTDAAKRFAEQTPSKYPYGDVSKHFGIPHVISYKSEDGSVQGMSRTASHRLVTAGVLFLSQEGPYAIYCPDVQAKVAKIEAEGYIAEDPAKSWRPLIPGCRLIPEEQWKLYVARREYDDAMARASDQEAR